MVVERVRTLGEAVRVLVGVLAGTPVGEFVDARGLARLVVLVAGAEGASEALVQVAEVVGVLDAGAQRAARIRLRHRAARGALG